MTTGIAGAFNTMFHGLGAQLMTPETQQTISEFVTNTVRAFQQLAPAVAPFTKAMAQIAAVGSGALPAIATAATNAAKAFSQFINTNAANGNLSRWLNEGLTTLKQLGQLTASFGKDLAELAPIGEKVLPDIVKVFQQIGKIMPEIGAAALLLGPAFGPMSVAAHGVETAVKAIGTAFHAVEDVVKSVVNAIIPVINSMGSAISSGMQPIRDMIDAANHLPGINIPQIPTYSGIPQWTDPNQVYGGAGAQRERRGATPLPTAGLPGIPDGGFPVLGTLGSSVMTPTPTGPSWSAPGSPFGSSKESKDSGTGGGSSADKDRYAGLNVNDYLPPNMPSVSGYAGDGALLAGVPAGRYDPSGDLSKGLGDCSSAVEDLVNILDGQPTAGRQMSTGNEAEWLSQHGFLPTNVPMPGTFQVGFNPEHTQATLPGGTNFNWGSNAAAANRGIGGSGAWDRAFTQHFYRPVSGGGDPAVLEAAQNVQRQGYDLAKARMDVAATERDPKATNFEKSDAQQRAIEAGWQYNDALNKLAEAQQGTYKKMAGSATTFADGMQQIGAKLDKDFGISKGLPGIVENITKMLANLAMAPVLGALSGVTAANGTAGPGTGLLGALAPRQNVFGQEMPNVLGQYAPQQEMPGGFSPIASAPTTPLPAAWAGVNSGYSPLTGPELTNPALSNPIPHTGGRGLPMPRGSGLTTGTRNTVPQGIPLGQGLPKSGGIQFGKGGLTGLVGSAISSAAGLAGGMGSMGGGGAAASAAAQIAIDEIGRGISYGSQVAGIGIEGLMSTFLPVSSAQADPLHSWLGKIVGAVGGVAPAAQNLAGNLTQGQKGDKGDRPGSDPLTPQQVAKGDQERSTNNTSNQNITNNIDYNAAPGANGDPNYNAFTDHVATSWQMPGPR